MRRLASRCACFAWEDSEDDAALVLRALRRGGYAPTLTRVQTHAEFKAALETNAWDVIISDHTLPSYGGLTALSDLQRSGKDLPFILVSGTIGEKIAVTVMKSGAQDYVLKDDLTRLPAAVERELRETSLRAQQAKMREQLMISERMATAGAIAAGIAHEINNPLAVAAANVDFVADALERLVASAKPEGDGARPPAPGCAPGSLAAMSEPLQDAREALQRIRDIVRDVKLFSRPDDDVSSALDVRRVIDSATRMASNEIRHRARLVKDYRDVSAVQANESRLGQVILNLVINATHAIPEGHADGNEIRVNTRMSKDHRVVVEVADTGSGIPKENLERIFDPFFTTKAVGVDTGLGLAICHRIVASLGGHIDVKSKVGKGTVFSVVLPATDVLPVERPPPAASRPATTRGRVLVVDDEAGIGRALERTLTEHHDVVAVTRAEDALAKVRAGERFDVILSDVMMPEVSGMEMHWRLQSAFPDQARRVVFLTGGAFTPAARDFLASVPNPCLEKPFDPKALLAVIAELTHP